MYVFVFDRRSLNRLRTGALLAAALLVSGGFLIGVRQNLPQDTAKVAAAPVGLANAGRRLLQPPPATTPPVEPLLQPELSPSEDPKLGPDPSVAEIPAPFDAVLTVPPPRMAFSIQVGAYTIEDNARRELSTLAARGYEPYILSTGGAVDRPILRVVIGSYGSREEASLAAARFTADERRESLVRPMAEI